MKFLTYVLVMVLAVSLLGCNTEQGEPKEESVGTQAVENSQEGMLLFDALSLREEEISSVCLQYRASAEESVLLRLYPKDKPFALLFDYLNVPLSRVDIPVEMYEVDPLEIVLETASDNTALQFITTEGKTAADTETYLILDQEVYQLENQETALAEASPAISLMYLETQALRDPLWQFFQYAIIMPAEETYEVEGDIWRLPDVSIEDYPVLSMEEMIREADEIYSAKVTALQAEEQEGDPLYDEGYLALHAEHINMPAHHFTDLQMEVTEGLYGTHGLGEAVEIRVPFGEHKSGEGSQRSFGISQKNLEVGKEYVVFMKNLECEDSEMEWVADYYFGVMEKTEEGKLRPMFNLSPDVLEEYCISLGTLKEKIASEKGA